MRVVFQAGSLGKDHWEIFVIFFSSIKHWTASSISASLSFPLATLQPTSGINTCSPCKYSQNAWPLCLLVLKAHDCVTGGSRPECLQPSSGAWLPKPPSSQTPVLKSCTVHLSHPGYPASSGCHSCFISAPIVTSCKQEVPTFDWFCLAIIDSVSQCPTPLPQDLGIHSIIQEIIIEFPLWSTHWARCWQYSGKY